MLFRSTYQVVMIFAVFHILLRGFYKHYKVKVNTKLKLFYLLLSASLLCSAVIVILDLLPIVISLVPYSLDEYLTSIMHQESIGSALTAYFFYNFLSILAWAYLYVLIAGISNYKQLALLLKKQELQILTNRVNPEFLFDTMQAIKHKIDIDEEQAADLVTQASDLFRYNLMSSKTPDAKLSDEVASVENYLKLLKEQNKAPSKHKLQLHDQQLAPNIPSMTLIFICSFLQNSARKRDGELRIVSFLKQHRYRIEISHQSHGKFFLDTEHFDNVKTRLEHQYGSSASMVLVKRGRRRKVVIELPVEEVEKAA